MNRLVVAAVAAVALLPACTEGGPKMEVQVTLDEFSISLTPDAEDEGTVRFFIDNAGEKDHTVYFARGSDPSKLPRAADGSVDLSKLLVSDRLDAIGPGRYRIQPDLLPGPLVVFCNLVTDGVSHFAEGMYATFEVKRTREEDVRDVTP